MSDRLRAAPHARRAAGLPLAERQLVVAHRVHEHVQLDANNTVKLSGFHACAAARLRPVR